MVKTSAKSSKNKVGRSIKWPNFAKNGKKGAGEKLKFAEKVLFSNSNKLKLKYIVNNMAR